MPNLFIPQAQAQVTGALSAGKDAAVEASSNGLESLIRYVANNLDNWIFSVIILALFYLLSRMAAKAMREAIISKKGEDIQEASLILVERITVISITGIGITIALAINGLNFTAVIGAFSLGIGFALKDIIGNFISGVIMLSQDQVRIGHFIKAAGVSGKIVSIDTRATVLKAIDGTEVVIPNQNMLNETIVNYSINPFRRIELITYASWSCDVNQAIDLVSEVLAKNQDILRKPASNVLLHNLEDDSNYVIRVLFWVETSKKWLKIRSDVHRAILKAFAENGISVDYPTQTLTFGEEELEAMRGGEGRKSKPIPLRISAEPSSSDRLEIEQMQEDEASAQELEIPAENQALMPQAPQNPVQNPQIIEAQPEPQPIPLYPAVPERPAPPTHL